jgi:hypothetical protein
MSMVGDCKSVAAMGQAPFVAVLAEGVRGTMIVLAISENGIGASRVKLMKEGIRG